MGTWFSLLPDLEGAVLEMVDGMVFLFVLFSILMRSQGWKAIFRIDMCVNKAQRAWSDRGSSPRNKLNTPGKKGSISGEGQGMTSTDSVKLLS